MTFPSMFFTERTLILRLLLGGDGTYAEGEVTSLPSFNMLLRGDIFPILLETGRKMSLSPSSLLDNYW
jgi:hypothetical protein